MSRRAASASRHDDLHAPLFAEALAGLGLDLDLTVRRTDLPMAPDELDADAGATPADVRERGERASEG
ncbi:hypothetical protein ACWGAN_21065 [Streptomyces sp. NPDC054945]